LKESRKAARESSVKPEHSKGRLVKVEAATGEHDVS
jgi:hypothetical protein